MDVIVIESEAFYKLIEAVVERLNSQAPEYNISKWISATDAMDLLNIKSKTTLQKLRDEGFISFSQPQKKIILYDRDSINSYLEQHKKNSF